MPIDAIGLDSLAKIQVVLFQEVLWALHQLVLEDYMAAFLHLPKHFLVTIRKLGLLAEELSEV